MSAPANEQIVDALKANTANGSLHYNFPPSVGGPLGSPGRREVGQASVSVVDQPMLPERTSPHHPRRLRK